MQLFKDILYLFFPKICVSCSNHLVYNEKIICTSCKYKLPIIVNNTFLKKRITSKFINTNAIQDINCFLLYNKHNISQKLIQQLKYKNRQDIGQFLGTWFANEIIKYNFFNTIDYIIPVPLHAKKLKKRGYNQLTLFGKELSKALQKEYLTHLLIKTTNTNTQTSKKRFERHKNTNESFTLTNSSFLKNKHILLIDDVITTGATIKACCKELQKTPNITISVASLAFTDKI